MMHIRWALAALWFLTGPASAQGLLPVAMDHQSAGFYLDGTSARLPTGTRVEFTYKDANGVPKRLPHVRGFVLGIRDNVIFFELKERDAAQLARLRTAGKVKFQKTRDPVAEEVASRRQYKESGHAIRLAPMMRRLTVTMALDPATVAEWTPGETLTFYKVGKHTWRDTYYDVQAMFRSASAVGDGEFEVMIVADPNVASDILRAEIEGRLTTKSNANGTDGPIAKRCYVTERSTEGRTRIEIPCAN